MTQGALPSWPSVWLVDTKQYFSLVQSERWFAAGLITSDELVFASRYFNVRSKMQYLAGRALVRSALMQVANYNPSQIRIVLGDNNKPILAENTTEAQWHFNISHSGDLVACALARSRIGIDLEMISHTVDYLPIARAHFADEEAKWVGAKQIGINKRFVALWTIKEAYLKAIGIGLAVPLNRVIATGIKLRSCHVFLEDMMGRAKWHCRLVRPVQGYLLSVCSETAIEGIKIRWANL